MSAFGILVTTIAVVNGHVAVAQSPLPDIAFYSLGGCVAAAKPLNQTTAAKSVGEPTVTRTAVCYMRTDQ